jgi:CubicO group peptidase (beta-lactamase class C family)
MKPESRKRHGWLYRIGVVAFVLVLILGIGSAIFHERLIRLYRVIRLFDQDVIVENFRHMDGIIGTRTVHKADQVTTFEKDPQPLPASFTYNGESIDLQQFLKDQYTTGMIVIKDNKIAFEEYWLGNDDKSVVISWSVAKSMISALIGIAMDEGLIMDVDDPVTDYVPFLKGTGYDNVPIKHILQMSSGIGFNENYGDFNSDINRLGRLLALNTSIDEFVASLKNIREPGTYNQYVSMDTQVLSMVLREVTGKTVAEYMEEKLWKKIGTESDGYWLIDNNGVEIVFGCYNAVLRDYARFGQLYLNDGKWNGETVVPADWVKASVTPDAPHLQPGNNPLSYWVLGYGHQWWIPQNPEGDFLAVGVAGQYIYVHPAHGLVIAKSSAYGNYKKDGKDKILQTIEMFRAIVKSMANGEKAKAA